jgi:type I restriction enzyme S subunit
MDKREAIGIRDLSFELTTVGDLVRRGVLERPIDGNHGEIHPKASDFVTEGVPFIMASDIKHGRVNYQKCTFITERQADSLRKGFAKNGDVLLTHKATIGETAIVDYDKHPYIMLTPQVTYYRIKDRKALNNRYLKAYFDSSLFQQTLHMLAGSGSTRAYLGITDQHRLPIILPPPDKQKKIAAVLATLDDLIANNQRRIALLESMAEEIYREWFVRMRFPGAPYGLSCNNPPADWTLIELPKLASITYGFPFVGERFSDLSIGKKVIRIRDVLAGDSSTYTDEVADDKYVVQAGDLLIGMDGEFHMNHWIAEDAYLVQRTCRIRPKQKRLRAYLALALKAPINHYQQIIVGATVGHLGAKHLNAIKLLVPSDDLKPHLEKLNGLLDQRIILSKQNLRLAKSREALLPRLISGKLRVDQLDIQYPPSMMAELAQAA